MSMRVKTRLGAERSALRGSRSLFASIIAVAVAATLLLLVPSVSAASTEEDELPTFEARFKGDGVLIVPDDLPGDHFWYYTHNGEWHSPEGRSVWVTLEPGNEEQDCFTIWTSVEAEESLPKCDYAAAKSPTVNRDAIGWSDRHGVEITGFADDGITFTHPTIRPYSNVVDVKVAMPKRGELQILDDRDVNLRSVDAETGDYRLYVEKPYRGFIGCFKVAFVYDNGYQTPFSPTWQCARIQ